MDEYAPYVIFCSSYREPLLQSDWTIVQIFLCIASNNLCDEIGYVVLQRAVSQ